MLEEVGEPYEIELLDLKEGDQRKPAYLALNPMGKVPTLVRRRRSSSPRSLRSAAIWRMPIPAAKLAPPIGDARRGPYLKWLFFGPSCLEPAMIDKALNRPAAPRGTAGWADYDTVVEVLRRAVGDTPYLLGEQFTAADVVIGAGIRWGMMFKMLPELPEFIAYTQRLARAPRAAAPDREGSGADPRVS